MVEFLKTSKGHNFKPDAIQTLSKGYSELRSNGPFYRPNSFSSAPNVNQTCCGWVCIWIGSGIEKMSSSNTVKPDLKQIQAMNEPGAAAVAKKSDIPTVFGGGCSTIFLNYFLLWFFWTEGRRQFFLWCCEVCWLYWRHFLILWWTPINFFLLIRLFIADTNSITRKSNIFAFQSFCFLFFIIEILASVIHSMSFLYFSWVARPLSWPLSSIDWKLCNLRRLSSCSRISSPMDLGPYDKRYSRIDNAL